MRGPRRGEVLLRLTEEERRYLQDILDIWIEGHEPAINDVIIDRTITDEETLLLLVGGLQEQMIAAVKIRNHLLT